jgi:2-haloacid dehalogenase
MIKAFVFDAYGTLYDIQSVATVTEQAFPGYGDLITQIWRMKQLEYTWQRSMMKRYEDFSIVTRDSLTYTLQLLGLDDDPAAFDRIMDKYVHLDLYPDAKATLDALSNYKRAILSNGSPAMLNALVKNTGLDRLLDATISVDRERVYKPDPRTSALIETTLGVKPDEVIFVSSNPFDVAGAKSFGLNVAWIERVTPAAMAAEFKPGAPIRPLSMFKATRTQMDEIGYLPDHRIGALSDLPKLAGS